MACRLAKAGWYSGDPGKVLAAPVDEVLAALQYDNFQAECERAIYDLNKENPS